MADSCDFTLIEFVRQNSSAPLRELSLILFLNLYADLLNFCDWRTCSIELELLCFQNVKSHRAHFLPVNLRYRFLTSVRSSLSAALFQKGL